MPDRIQIGPSYIWIKFPVIKSCSQAPTFLWNIPLLRIQCIAYAQQNTNNYTKVLPLNGWWVKFCCFPLLSVAWTSRNTHYHHSLATFWESICGYPYLDVKMKGEKKLHINNKRNGKSRLSMWYRNDNNNEKRGTQQHTFSGGTVVLRNKKKEKGCLNTQYPLTVIIKPFWDHSLSSETTLTKNK